MRILHNKYSVILLIILTLCALGGGGYAVMKSGDTANYSLAGSTIVKATKPSSSSTNLSIPSTNGTDSANSALQDQQQADNDISQYQQNEAQISQLQQEENAEKQEAENLNHSSSGNTSANTSTTTIPDCSSYNSQASSIEQNMTSIANSESTIATEEESGNYTTGNYQANLSALQQEYSTDQSELSNLRIEYPGCG